MLVPVHPNPRIAPRMRQRLGGHAQFTLVAPMAYREFIAAAAQRRAGHQRFRRHPGRSAASGRAAARAALVHRAPGGRGDRIRAPRRGGPRRHRRARRSRCSRRRARAACRSTSDAPFGDGAAAARIVDVLEAVAGRRDRGMSRDAETRRAPGAPSPPPAPRTAADDGAIAALAADGPAQLRTGAHAGAVAGCIDGVRMRRPTCIRRSPATTCSGSRGARHDSATRRALAERAAAVQRWLAEWLAAGDPPPTRVHLRRTCRRLAQRRRVLLRRRDGAARTCGAAARAAARRPMRRSSPALSRAARAPDRGRRPFDACVRTAPAARFPDRWSTRRGGVPRQGRRRHHRRHAHVLPGVSGARRRAPPNARSPRASRWLARTRRIAKRIRCCTRSRASWRCRGIRAFRDVLPAVADAVRRAARARRVPTAHLPETLDAQRQRPRRAST